MSRVPEVDPTNPRPGGVRVIVGVGLAAVVLSPPGLLAWGGYELGASGNRDNNRYHADRATSLQRCLRLAQRSPIVRLVSLSEQQLSDCGLASEITTAQGYEPASYTLSSKIVSVELPAKKNLVSAIGEEVEASKNNDPMGFAVPGAVVGGMLGLGILAGGGYLIGKNRPAKIVRKNGPSAANA